MEVLQSQVNEFINAGDTKRYAEQFATHKMLVIPEFMPREFVVNHYLPEVEGCTKFIHRVRVPRFKKSGSVSSQNIKLHAPNIYSLYTSPLLKQFVERVVGEPLFLCPESDPHSVALYNYTEPGDHIGNHYDKSFYKGRRYTVLLGMIQDSVESKLVCYPGANKLNRRKNSVEVLTHPGTLVVFNGDSLWHEVTPLGENERRVILTMEFLSDARISSVNRWISNFKDRYLYFGKA